MDKHWTYAVEEITIKTKSNLEAYEIADDIHKQLVGNPDYVESAIILNRTGNIVTIVVFNDAKPVDIHIPALKKDDDNV